LGGSQLQIPRFAREDNAFRVLQYCAIFNNHQLLILATNHDLVATAEN